MKTNLELERDEYSVVDERLRREKAYHNRRFSEECREAQRKYYVALRDCFDQYHKTVMTLSDGCDVLEYGCAKGEKSLALAPICKSIVGVDISDVAIAQAEAFARQRSLENARYYTMNAENMSFEDRSFDLVFGSGIIHHLDLGKCFAEISRVLRPGGSAVFVEPLGTNILFNTYRALTPKARTPDEHPLQNKDFELAQEHFEEVNLSFYGLTTLSCVPFRNTAVFRYLFDVTRAIDRVIFKSPTLKWQAWYVLVRLTR